MVRAVLGTRAARRNRVTEWRAPRRRRLGVVRSVTLYENRAEELRERQRQMPPHRLQATEACVGARAAGNVGRVERPHAVAHRLRLKAPEVLVLVRAGADLAAPEVERARPAAACEAHQLPVQEIVRCVAEELAPTAGVVRKGDVAEA